MHWKTIWLVKLQFWTSLTLPNVRLISINLRTVLIRGLIRFFSDFSNIYKISIIKKIIYIVQTISPKNLLSVFELLITIISPKITFMRRK